MKKCNEKIFVRVLHKTKRCIKPCLHSGKCSPDLVGEKFGTILVIKQGKQRKWADGTFRSTWVIDQKGAVRTVTTRHLLSGQIAGIKDICGMVTCPNGKMSPEYCTVYMHWRSIFNPKSDNHNRYKGVPFHNDWNPRKGGAFWKGVKWIIDNLGKKPQPHSNWSLDVIEHDKGFVPGNLRWAKLHVQARNKRHKILGRFTISEIRVEARRHGYKLVRA